MRRIMDFAMAGACFSKCVPGQNPVEQEGH